MAFRVIQLLSVNCSLYKSAKHLHLSVRLASSSSMARRGIVLGLYEGEEKGDSFTLSKSGRTFAQEKANGLLDQIEQSGLYEKKGNVRTFYGLDKDFSTIAVVKVGKRSAGYNQQEQIEEKRENVRNAVAAGVKRLIDEGVSSIYVDPLDAADAAAEAAYLSNYKHDELKDKEKRLTPASIKCFTHYLDDAHHASELWKTGQMLAEGQNLARYLMDSPANLMTPTHFAEIAVDRFSSIPTCQVVVHDKAWAESMKMGSFLSVAKGSDEPLRFVEVIYNGGIENDPPFAFVGKGITFDSGGISIKPSANMDAMKADMGGAAVLISSIYAAAKLKLNINVRGFFPLCENLPNGSANKPGDIVTSMSGKTIQVDNTDAEGRLILCDALTYAQTFNPLGIVDMATLTGAMMVAAGSAASGVFSNSEEMWTKLQKAGEKTGDRVWRFPLFKHYTKQVEGAISDLNNLGSATPAGGACTAAAFLREFVTNDHWMHMDIAGVMGHKAELPYLSAGMSGRPTRTMVEFLKSLT